MGNEVAVLGESGTFAVRASPGFGVTDEMEFESASFRGGVDERRVIGVFMAIPASGKRLEIRFEFTDHGFATVDLNGTPVNLPELPEIKPYTEPRGGRRINEGR